MTSDSSTATPLWTEHDLAVPGATLRYHLAGPAGAPLVALVGHPMGADDFRALGEALATGPDARRVLLHDPRGFGASPLDDPDDDADPDRLADDLAALVQAAGLGQPGEGGRADVFGSSGGAVTGLAFAERHPDLLGTLLAHEPPLYRVLADATEKEAQARGVVEVFHEHGLWPAMGAFMALAGFDAPAAPAGHDDDAPPAPPAEPSPEQVAAMTRLVSRSIVPVCGRRTDVAALQAAETGGSRVVLLAGQESGTQLARRGAEGVAALLDRKVVLVTGGHTDWVLWQGQDPARFAAQVRELLTA